MSQKVIDQKIKRKKIILNFVLRYLHPTNKISVFLSQDLDKAVSEYQEKLYKKHKRKKRKNSLEEVA